MRDLYRDFRKDWRRWTRGEQASAVLIGLVSVTSPAFLLVF